MTNKSEFKSSSRLEKVLRSGRFAVTSELNPPDSADPEDVYRAALTRDEYRQRLVEATVSGLMSKATDAAPVLAAFVGLAGVEDLELTSRDQRLAQLWTSAGARCRRGAGPRGHRGRRLRLRRLVTACPSSSHALGQCAHGRLPLLELGQPAQLVRHVRVVEGPTVGHVERPHAHAAARGGDGAVRELIERLLRAKQHWEELLPN